MENSIEIENLCCQFGEFIAVDDLSLTVPQGAFYGFLGANGAGKTTTLQMLTGLLPNSSGTIRIMGIDVEKQPLEAKARLAFLPEEPALYDALTAMEFLLYIGQLRGLSVKLTRERSDQLLTLLGISTEARERFIGGYSMGMRKKTALAACLLTRPDVLFMDEPFNGLDAHAVQVLSLLFTQLTAQGTTLFFSSHNLDKVEQLCTHVAIIGRGKLLTEGTPKDLCQTYNLPNLEAVFLHLTEAPKDITIPNWLGTKLALYQ
jgi:ABC-2 type transport system ATP-binding protein